MNTKSLKMYFFISIQSPSNENLIVKAVVNAVVISVIAVVISFDDGVNMNTCFWRILDDDIAPY